MDPSNLNLLCDAYSGKRGEDQKIIAEVGTSFLDLLLKKNADYGSSVFASPALHPKMHPADALLVRMSDKIARIKNLLSGTDPQITSEPLEDTIKDLGAYCLLWLCVKKKQESVKKEITKLRVHTINDEEFYVVSDEMTGFRRNGSGELIIVLNNGREYNIHRNDHERLIKWWTEC